MDAHGWRGHGSSNQPDTGIAQALDYYARFGGELLGARRSDNPLTLTHVRWYDQSGHMLDAAHSPEMEGYISAAEREVWVQLALDLPIAAAGMYGAQAPWERLALDPERATELLAQLRRSLASHASGTSNNPAQWSSGVPFPPPAQAGAHGYSPNPPALNGPWPGGQSGAPGVTFPPPFQVQPLQPLPPQQMYQQQPPSPPSPPYQPPQGAPQQPPPFQQRPPSQQQSFGAGASGQQAPMGDAREWTNSQRMGQGPEVTVIPCVEVDLPPVLTDPSAADQARDFTRDVARHFNRAARQLPQMRETRGWMRNGRMILAVRLMVAPGSRVPSSIEMETAAQMLADALARNMLPYTRMTFAEPGEWSQGVALPD
jgi:hypothetical protein